MRSDELKAWRTEHGLSRDALARMLETTVNTIYRWETDTDHNRKIPPYLQLALERIEQKLKTKP